MVSQWCIVVCTDLPVIINFLIMVFFPAGSEKQFKYYCTIKKISVRQSKLIDFHVSLLCYAVPEELLIKWLFCIF